jgi:hypothetical protein
MRNVRETDSELSSVSFFPFFDADAFIASSPTLHNALFLASLSVSLYLLLLLSNPNKGITAAPVTWSFACFIERTIMKEGWFRLI